MKKPHLSQNPSIMGEGKKQTLDVAEVQNIGKKSKNPCGCSKFPLHKNFKLSLDQNVV